MRTSPGVWAALGFAAAVLATPAAAEPLPESDARFQIERLEEGFLRLDKQTGAVEMCVEGEPAFACREVMSPPEEPSSSAPIPTDLLAEVQTLRTEVAELRRRLNMIAALAGDGAQAEASAATATAIARTPNIPAQTRRDIDQALDVTDYTIRRFIDLFSSLEQAQK